MNEDLAREIEGGVRQFNDDKAGYFNKGLLFAAEMIRNSPRLKAYTTTADEAIRLARDAEASKALLIKCLLGDIEIIQKTRREVHEKYPELFPPAADDGEVV